MAEAVFNSMATEKSIEFIADSCGLYADGTSYITENAKNALLEIGIECEHVSKPLSEKMLAEADYILGITNDHARAVISMFPQYSKKVYAFPLDITDPYGGDISVYKECLKQIQKGVDSIVNSLSEQ